MSAVPPQHIQPIGPVCPSWLVRCNLIGQGPLMCAQQREWKRGRCDRRWWRQIILIAQDIRWRDTGFSRNLAYKGDVYSVWQILEAISNRKLDRTVDIMQVFQTGILIVSIAFSFVWYIRPSLTKRMNRHGRLGRRTTSRGDEAGSALINQAPWSKHWIRCWRTNSKDSLYNLARRFLNHNQ